MRAALLLMIVAVIAVALTPAIVPAVGYEPLYPEEAKVSKLQPAGNGTPALGNGGAVTWVKEKGPAMIEYAAFFIRDVLSQFGLVDKKVP